MAQVVLDCRTEMPEWLIPDKVVVIVEGFDSRDGEITLWVTGSEDLSTWQELGMLRAIVVRGEDALRQVFQPDPDEADDDDG